MGVLSSKWERTERIERGFSRGTRELGTSQEAKQCWGGA